MAILKSSPKPPRNETLQLRVEEEIKLKLSKYAEFIDSSESYVVSEALKLVFRKDSEFETWLEQHKGNHIESANGEEPPLLSTTTVRKIAQGHRGEEQKELEY
jgi:predicted transcriptional regulator